MRHLGSAEKECEDLHLASSSSGRKGAASEQETEKEEEEGRISERDKPRFSLPELKEILQERNSLKARVSDLEDELAMYRPKTNEKYGIRHIYVVVCIRTYYNYYFLVYLQRVQRELPPPRLPPAHARHRSRQLRLQLPLQQEDRVGRERRGKRRQGGHRGVSTLKKKKKIHRVCSTFGKLSVNFQ